MHFVTRERVHVDRVATAWAIRRFVDPKATFEFVPASRDVLGLNGIPFDFRGVELGHHQGGCTFDALLAKYELHDPGLRRMAQIIRSADLPQESRASEADGVRAILTGIRDSGKSDEERLRRGFVVCEALYWYCLQTPEAGDL